MDHRLFYGTCLLDELFLYDKEKLGHRLQIGSFVLRYTETRQTTITPKLITDQIKP